jgi:hypothetical protein
VVWLKFTDLLDESAASYSGVEDSGSNLFQNFNKFPARLHGVALLRIAAM